MIGYIFRVPNISRLRVRLSIKRAKIETFDLYNVYFLIFRQKN